KCHRTAADNSARIRFGRTGRRPKATDVSQTAARLKTNASARLVGHLAGIHIRIVEMAMIATSAAAASCGPALSGELSAATALPAPRHHPGQSGGPVRAFGAIFVIQAV